MRLIDLLRKLALLGDKIPEAMAIISRLADTLKDGLQLIELPSIFADIKALIEMFSQASPAGAFAAFGTSEQDEEEALISCISANCEANATPGVYAALDGSRIKNLIEFVKNNPQLLAILLSLL